MVKANTKCGGCSKAVGTPSVQCTICDLWFHPSCGDINDTLLKLITTTTEQYGSHCWSCRPCQSSVKSINKKVVMMESRLQKIEDTISNQTETIQLVDDKIGKLSKEVESVKKKVDSVNTSDNSKNDVFKELSERENRKENIVMYNITESSSRDAETRKEFDKDEIRKVLEVLKCTEVNEDDIKFLYRAGERSKNSSNDSPRPLVVGFRNEVIQNKVICSCRYLKDSVFKHLSILPDLTPMQRQEEKNMREECRQKNADLNNEEQGNYLYKVIGKKGQGKIVKTRIHNPNKEIRNPDRNKRNRSLEETSPGPSKKGGRNN